MSRGRGLQVGDKAMTDYNGNGFTIVTITKRESPAISGSGILFCVEPPLKGGFRDTLYDADWFEPLPEIEQR